MRPAFKLGKDASNEKWSVMQRRNSSTSMRTASSRYLNHPATAVWLVLMAGCSANQGSGSSSVDAVGAGSSTSVVSGAAASASATRSSSSQASVVASISSTGLALDSGAQKDGATASDSGYAGLVDASYGTLDAGPGASVDAGPAADATDSAVEPEAYPFLLIR